MKRDSRAELNHASAAGVGGTLFPARYVRDRLIADAGIRSSDRDVDLLQHRLHAWWRHVVSSCGPATGVRALFDLVAMPLAAILGFRASGASFAGSHARARLTAPHGAVVGLLVMRWAHRPPTVWRDAITAARDVGSDWCLVVASPHLAVIDARSGWSRRVVDFTCPDAFGTAEGAAVMHAAASARAFDVDSSHHGDRPALEQLVTEGLRFQDGVREDLQHGVHDALMALLRVLPAARGSNARFDEALTLVYRVLFLLFVESRDLVPWRHPVYRGSYAIGTLARDALASTSGKGLWDGLAAITRLLRRGCRIDDLVVRPFNGRLFARASAPALEAGRAARRGTRGARGRDAAMTDVLVALSTRTSRGGREMISYADLGVEQLGAVYERILDLDPDNLAAVSSSEAHSERRKRTGTFYTPRALTEFLVHRTLGPLVSRATADGILALRVVDPAMGSGAFLVAACRYLASAYERALIDEGRISEHDVDESDRADMRRLIAQRCLYGVDQNPVAVQLARLSLWLSTLAHGKPLSFLDHRLRAGNSLIGATPDDLRHVSDGRRQPVGSLPLFDLALEDSFGRAVQPLSAIAGRPDDSIDDVRAKEVMWAHVSGDASPLLALRQASDLWCARWFWRGTPPPSAAETRAAIDALLRRDRTLSSPPLMRWLTDAAAARSAHGFFHWPIEFADVFYDGIGCARPGAGFDVVIANPPWEVLRRDNRALVRFIRESGHFPSCDHGHMNLYQPFVDRALSLARRGGRVGLVLPWGLATDDGAATLRSRLLDRADTHTLVGFDNADGVFPIHRGLRFLALVTTPGGPTREIKARFGVRTAQEIDRLADDEAEPPNACVRLTPARLSVVGGNTRRIPDARHPGDLDLLDALARRFPPLGGAEGWSARFGRELNATEDRPSFTPHGLPVIEGKHIQPFRADPTAASSHISKSDAAKLLPDRRFEQTRLAYRDVSGVGNRLTLIATLIPSHVVTTHTLFCLRTPVPRARQHFLCALFNSFVLNFVVRALMGGHLTTNLVEGLPVPLWRGTPEDWRIARLAVRLASPGASAQLAAAHQAGVARLYQLDAETFGRVLQTFPLVPEGERKLAMSLFLGEKPA